MPNDFGFDFRDTAAYVTDPSYGTFVIGVGSDPQTIYPTTRTVNGVSLTFGWETNLANVGSRNRDNTVIAPLAGINFINNISGFTATFRVDLPRIGIWAIGVALGDAAGGNGQNNKIQISDTNTPVLSLTKSTTATTFSDAVGNLWTIAQWPTNNVMVNVTFTTTILRLQLGPQSTSLTNAIATMRIIFIPPAGFPSLSLTGAGTV